jgi:signal transduction histidine kinase
VNVLIQPSARAPRRLRTRVAVGYASVLTTAFVAVLFADALGRSHDPVDAFHALLRGSIPVLLVGLVVCCAIGWWAASRTMGRLDALTTVARSVSSEQLDERVGPRRSRDEIATLAEALNSMLDRLQVAFELERRFARSASHELRTPLTVIRGELEIALDRAEMEAAEWRTTAEMVQKQVDRLIDVVDRLLTLPVAADACRQAKVRLAPIVNRQLGLYTAAMRSRSLTLATDLQDVSIDGDSVLIEQLVRNLVDNAVTHNIDGGLIDVRVEQPHGQPRLRVTNWTSDAAAPARGNATGESLDGHGIGLPLTEAIARAHGGTVAATAPRPGVIDTTVTFPIPTGEKVSD